MQRKPWKKYKQVRELVDSLKKYSFEEGVSLAKKSSYTKFVGSMEIHIKTSADPKYNDQMIRGTVVLPNGIGKVVKVAAFVSDDKVEEAKKAWAEIVWNELLLKDIENGKIEFDVLITTGDMMRDLAKAAKILWPRGLMPSPKAGTVTNNIKQTIEEIKKWRVEFKLDKTGNIHTIVGKLDFDDAKLIENIQALLKAIEEAKPAWVKWKLFKKVSIAPTMGPWVTLDC